MAIPVLALAAAQSAYQLYQSERQKREARKLQKSTFIPPALKEAAGSARAQAQATKYPGQETDESNLRQTVADTFANVSKATTSPQMLVNTASKLAGMQQRGYRDIARQGQGFRQNAMDRYRSVLFSQADQEAQNQRQFEASRSALRGAAQRNQYNALTTLLSGAALSQGMNPQTYQPLNQYPHSPYHWNFNPNMFSSFQYNPNAFSVGFSRR